MNKLGLIGLVILGAGCLLEPAAAVVGQGPSRRSPPSQERPIRPRSVCPTELQPLAAALLRDLPSYINRLNLRLLPKRGQASYAIAASQPELEPLPVNSSEFNNPNDASLRQVFFTVLERQYTGKQVTEFQEFHWLFLAQTQDGWRIALMFSRIGTSAAGNNSLLTPPRESSQSLTAQAINLWLRDCRAGAVKL